MPNVRRKVFLIEDIADSECSGGGFEINKQGESVQTRDHDFNHASVRCFVGSLQAKQPVDIVVGKKALYFDIPFLNLLNLILSR